MYRFWIVDNYNRNGNIVAYFVILVCADAVPTPYVRCFSSDTYYSYQIKLPDFLVYFGKIKQTMFCEIPETYLKNYLTYFGN